MDRDRIPAVAAVLVLVCSTALGWLMYHRGVSAGQTMQTQTTQAMDDRETRIMQIVIERNPDAPIKAFSGFARVVLTESQRAGIDYRLILAVIEKESEFNHRVVSAAGAIGLMQVMPGTALMMAKSLQMTDYDPPKGYGWGPQGRIVGHCGSLCDPKTNVRLGVEYLRLQVLKYGVGPVALRSYNRAPHQAREHWPKDRYAEEVALAYVQLTHRP